MATGIAEITKQKELRVETDQRWQYFRFVVAAILLTAAVMKSWQLATTPSLDDGLLHARWFNILVVEFELLFGVWLLMGVLPKLTWLASTGCFFVFASVSFYKAMTGEASCGCFGEAVVPPWYTMTFDLMIIGLLLGFRPQISWSFGLKTAKQHAFNYCLVVVPLCGFAFWGMSQVKFQQLNEIGQVLEQGGVVKLEPQSWLNKEFPLKDHCDVGEQITTGQWMVLLHRSGCTECREASPLIADLVKKKGCSLVVLEMNSGEGLSNFEEVSPLTGTMNQEISWFVETPVALELDNGFVKLVLLRDDLKRLRSTDLSPPLLFSQVFRAEVMK